MELEWGRPANCAGRLSKELRVYDFLDKLGVRYQRIDHPAADTMEACREIDASLNAVICKNLMLCNRQQTDFYLLMLEGSKRFETKTLSHQLGVSRLSFAAPEYLRKFLDITPGSVSVLGLINDTDRHVQLLIDADVLTGEYFGCHPCINTSSLRLRTRDLTHVILPALGRVPKIVTL